MSCKCGMRVVGVSLSLSLVVIFVLAAAAHSPAITQTHSASSVSHAELELDSPTYAAGAVQWAPYGSSRDPAPSVIAANMEGFVAQARIAHERGVQVLVFPEGGTGMFNAERQNRRDAMLAYCESIPTPSYTSPHPSRHHHFPTRSNINPCMSSGGNWSTTSQLYIMSCTAQQQQLILVFNTCDFQPCSSSTDPACPSDGRYQYNTQVMFNEHGDLVAKYHKVHLFGESAVFNQPAPVAVTFSTSLGVTFGTFVCFDIEYEKPALTLVEMGITHILFSTWWGNTLPAFIATMIQQGFSRQHQVALIAANTGAGVRRSGGGIFVAGDPLVTLYDTDGPDSGHVRQLIVAKVPITVRRHTNNKPSQPLHLAKNHHSNVHYDSTYVPCTIGPDFGPGNCSLITPTSGSSYTLTSTSGDISCSLDTTVDNAPNHETWALFSYQASIQYPNTPDLFSVEICSLTQCPNQGASWNGIVECSEVTSSSTIISSFVLTGSGFHPTTRLFPTLSLEKAQVQPIDMYHVHDIINGTHRTIQATNGRMITQTMFAANLFGVAENPPSPSPSYSKI